MAHVYPRAKVEPEYPAFDEALCAATIVALREEDESTSAATAIGVCLKEQGGSPADFYRVWGEVEAERTAMSAVPLQAEGAYMEALSEISRWVSPFDWIVGKRAELKVDEITKPAKEIELG